MDIILVHGYNVSSTSTYGVLPKRLADAGHTIKDVYLSKYVTLDDDITLADIVKGFDAALHDVYGAQYGKTEFACITHSTGGLVARAWVSTYFGGALDQMPMSHLIMLAPPTNGSRLAELGKSRLSRLRSLVGIEPGLKVLDALEIASEYQWDLNTDWIRRKLYAAPNFFPFVIAGQWIDHKLWDAIVPATYERGSDGVVRASAANLNMLRLNVAPDGIVSREVMDGVAYLVVPKAAHSDKTYGIMAGIPASGPHAALNAILSAIDVRTRADYAAVVTDFNSRTNALQSNDTYYDGSKLDRYCQIVFRVTDNRGVPLPDYAIELLDASGTGRALPSGFFGDKHQNEINPEMFGYYLNFDRMKDLAGGKFGFKVQCAADSPLVRYPDTIFIGSADVDSILKPNQTTFVDVVLNRQLNKSVFRLTENIAKQDIPGKIGDEWIEN